MAVMFADTPRFKRAILVSSIAHITLFLLFLLSPYLPSFQKKGTIFYVDMNTFGGGGGGGGNGSGGASLESKTTESQEVVETAPPTRESLKDLTVPDSLEQVEPELRHPMDKPEQKAKPKPDKQAVIQKTETTPVENKSRIPRPQSDASSTSGIRFGQIGEGGSGSGGGSGGGEGPGFGSGNSPYAYYFDRIQNTIASNWLTAQIRSGSSATLETHVRFRIYRDGRIGSVEITHSSDVAALDHSASRAVQSSRFPPLPQSMEGPYIILTVIFEHRR